MVVCYCIIMMSGYGMIRGVINPETIGYIKEKAGHNIQPWTAIIQIAGWFFLCVAHCLAWLFLFIWHEEKVKKDQFFDFLNDSSPKEQ